MSDEEANLNRAYHEQVGELQKYNRQFMQNLNEDYRQKKERMLAMSSNTAHECFVFSRA